MILLQNLYVMKIRALLLSMVFLLMVSPIFAQNLKPYTIGAYTKGDIKTTATKVSEQLKANGFNILGAYQPVDDGNRWIITYTSDDIISAVKKVGGLTGLATVWRVALTKENEQILISYPTPRYWGNAYFRDNFPKVEELYDSYAKKIEKALAACGEGGGTTFGSLKGLEVDKLRDYKYMIGMPKFNKTKKLNEFDSFQEAIGKIDDNLANGVTNLELVYEYAIPDMEIKVYGIGLSGENGETKFMPKIDTAIPKHTAFLPYEFIVVGNEVHMLHGRFRIALSFPDLKMGQFMKIVSTPPDIKKLMESATQ